MFLVVSAVRSGAEGWKDIKEALDAIHRQLLQADSEATWAEFTKHLQARADVKIYEEAL